MNTINFLKMFSEAISRYAAQGKRVGHTQRCVMSMSGKHWLVNFETIKNNEGQGKVFVDAESNQMIACVPKLKAKAGAQVTIHVEFPVNDNPTSRPFTVQAIPA